MGFWAFMVTLGSVPLFRFFVEGRSISIVAVVLVCGLPLALLERVAYEVRVDAGGETMTWRSPLRRGKMEIASIDRLNVDRLMGGLAIFRGPKPRLILMESHSAEFDELLSALISIRADRPFEVIDRRPASRSRETGFKVYFGPSSRR